MAKKKRYTKSDLAAALAEDFDIPKSRAMDILNKTLDYIHGSLIEGADVSLAGFGTFHVKRIKARKAYTGRNPFTGEENFRFKAKPARDVPRWRPSKALKDNVA